MGIRSISNGRIVIANGSVDETTGRPVRLSNAMVPFLLGLAGPVVLLVAISPHSLPRMPFLIAAILGAALVITLAIYVFCLAVPGAITAILADRRSGILELIEANIFATRSTTLGFDQIAGVNTVSEYDADGYAVSHAVLALRGGENIELPDWVSDGEIAALRKAVGLGR